ncbi:hypothetical protein HPP92_026309 [Vanilla planifolia]|uniref:Uncharacterized protein n=1 Tax=Vanilla planifolia TaxID=51239 RepID=A0A835PCM6_VANPL|nr:hypothetical protein HPP92_026535 [Vanilla planifolia]KAG0451284.1 hypothetical protein HPP92_026309 [Vanilla planifolia]
MRIEEEQYIPDGKRLLTRRRNASGVNTDKKTSASSITAGSIHLSFPSSNPAVQPFITSATEL